MRKISLWVVTFSVAVAFLIIDAPLLVSAKAVSYRIDTNSPPIDKTFAKFSTYNSYTKSYYVIRSYLEKLEQTGGTLSLKKGTYTITNTLYIPSNVTILLEDGVVIKKGDKTNLATMKPSTSLFQLIRPSRSTKSGVYGGYNGEQNIAIKSSKRAKIDLNFSKDTVGIVLGHNKKVLVENIDFVNMNSGHFIELTASTDVTIRNCTFKGSKPSPNRNKEAINIDTPDKQTEGYHQPWSKFDKTPVNNVLIEKNSFYDLDRAIGTHKYSQNKLHTNVTIRNNKIDKTRQDSIRVMNWSNPVITGNYIKRSGDRSKGFRGILASGTTNPNIYGNTFEDTDRPIQFIAWQNTGPGAEYPPIYDSISDQNISNLQKNTAINVTERFIRISTILYEYINGTKKIYLSN